MRVLLKGLVYMFRQLREASAFFLGIAVAFPLYVCAQASPMEELTRASSLNEEGRFTETIQAIGSFFAEGRPNDDAFVGIAWNIRGSALENLGDLEGARRSYETALAILHTKPDQVPQYASALDNLASLKADTGQLQESRSLGTRALQLYQSIGDNAGAARASINLALIVLAQRDRKGARQLLAEALKELSLVPSPDKSDFAALHNAQALECVRDNRLNDALNEINQTIGLWTERYGPRYYLLATGLSLRGQINNALHKGDDAREDFKHSLDIFGMNKDTGSKSYFIVEVEYANALRDSGERREADRLESAAKEGLQELSRRQCNGCSISVASFR